MHDLHLKDIFLSLVFIILLFLSQFLLKQGAEAFPFPSGSNFYYAGFLWIISAIVVYGLIIRIIQNKKNSGWKFEIIGGGFFYFIVVAGASVFLDEYVSIEQWLGVGLISVGVVLISGDS